MKKLLALLLILSICALCMFSCKFFDNNNPGTNDTDKEGSGEVEDNKDDIIDIGGEQNGDGILNSDNIDPNGWTKVD